MKRWIAAGLLATAALTAWAVHRRTARRPPEPPVTSPDPAPEPAAEPEPEPLSTTYSYDPATLQRILDGLHRL
ncbi:hypothetical protein [Saccharopolyspora sp. CA-218241]|uniref:hypothetical protein n=1 Tax=Saccharopolyspora sp. CA-218241 TaxID=3240027 RepID=UPI003D95925A